MKLEEKKVPAQLDLRVGDRVRVRPAEEILATLDADGKLDGLPFMPEMLAFCGQELTVFKRADKTCDEDHTKRRMTDAVHLTGLRCDGSAHGGCQAGCLIFWKEAWLQPVERGGTGPDGVRRLLPLAASPVGSAEVHDPSRCDRAGLEAATCAEDASGEPVYSCQATSVKAATTPLPAWEPTQYVNDVRSGNWPARKVLVGLAILFFNAYQKVSARVLPPKLRIRNGETYPFLRGELSKTPRETLDLQPGELVEVKTKEEILATLDDQNRNRGLLYDVEMLPYCGRRARVLRRVERIIDEHTGRMIPIGSDCIVLDGVVCLSDYHRFCGRSIYNYWREIWLRRVGDDV